MTQRTIVSHTSKLVDSCFLGDSVVTASMDGSIILWQNIQNEPIEEINNNSQSKDSNSICKNKISGVPILHIPSPDGAQLIDIQVTKEEDYVFAATHLSLRLYSLTTGDCLRHFKTNQTVNCIAIAPELELVFGGGSSGRLFAWNYVQGTTYKPFKQMNRKSPYGDALLDQKRHHLRSINHIAIYKNFIISAGDDQYIRQWSMTTGALISEYQLDAPVTRFQIINADESPWYGTFILTHCPHVHLNASDEIVLIFVQSHHQLTCLACIIDTSVALMTMFKSAFEVMISLHTTTFSIIQNKLLALYKRPFSEIEIYNFSNQLIHSFSIERSVFIHGMEERPNFDSMFQLVYMQNRELNCVSCPWNCIYSSQQNNFQRNYTNPENHFGSEVVKELYRKGINKTYALQVLQIVMERNKGEIDDSDFEFILYQCIGELETEFCNELITDIPSFLESKNSPTTYQIGFEYDKLHDIEALTGSTLTEQMDVEYAMTVLESKLDYVREKCKSDIAVDLTVNPENIFAQVCDFYNSDEGAMTKFYNLDHAHVKLQNTDNTYKSIDFRELMELFIPIGIEKLFKITDWNRKNSYYFQKYSQDKDFHAFGRCIAHCLLHHISLPNFDVCELVFKVLCSDSLDFSDLIHVYPDVHRLLGRLVKRSKEHSTIETANGPSLHYFDAGTQEELKPGGKRIRVDMENPGEYISLYACHRMYKHVQESIFQFLKGFHSLIPREMIIHTRPELLQLAICGRSPDVYGYLLRGSVVYSDIYYKTRDKHFILKWFWEIFDTILTRDERCILYENWSGTTIYRTYESEKGGAILISGNNSLSGSDILLNKSESALQISPTFKSLDDLKEAVLQLVKSL